MKQPVKGDGKVKRKRKTYKKTSPFKKLNLSNQKYGTSKLEMDFARNFLDKLGLVYIYQYEAKEIGRYFDFAVTAFVEKDYIMENKDGITCVKQDGQYFPIDMLIEVDGDYFHSNPKFYKKEELNPMQRHNKFVDNLKDRWAGLKCIPLIRIWENDIRNNPQKVINELLKYVTVGKKKRIILENKKKPH